MVQFMRHNEGDRAEYHRFEVRPNAKGPVDEGNICAHM
ncbi:hypothetical protein THARTR1_10278 [Trichoderma harzianum]|uniref:Uncharacterized protein n=1 Tax=Trichoderma harzianum TaxID=5544 RepID=A0A2K0TTI1_TRIHA|nr:hypothetical protein THARTR1_10278 [Trichoderma harzianum]